MTEEARLALDDIPGPISVICAAGPVGAGKSTLLNRAMLQVDNGGRGGFPTRQQDMAPNARHGGGSEDGCGGTLGIWLWSTPFRATASDGTEVSLLLLDTQGLPCDGEDEEADPEELAEAAALFAIARLLSSVVLYVSPEGITDAAIAALAAALAADPASALADGAAGPEPAAAAGWEEEGAPPRLLWAARDLSGDDPARTPLPPRQRLERALRDPPAAGGGGTAAARGRVRGAFPDRDCFPLTRPAGWAPVSPAPVGPAAARADSDRQVCGGDGGVGWVTASR